MFDPNARLENADPELASSGDSSYDLSSPDSQRKWLNSLCSSGSSHSLASADGREGGEGDDQNGVQDEFLVGSTRAFFVHGPGDLPQVVNAHGHVARVEPNRIYRLEGHEVAPSPYELNFDQQPGFQPGPFDPQPGFQQPGPFDPQPGFQQPGPFDPQPGFQQPGPFEPQPGFQFEPQPPVEQVMYTPWGLQRISQSDQYLYPDSAGAGVDIYVIDSGVEITHPELNGLARHGPAFVDNGDPTDLNGHGTHVAGILVSRTYGVAKRANVISVKCFGAAGTSNAKAILAGLNWVREEVRRNGNRPSIINMSISGKRDPVMEEAVSDAVRAGIYVIAAAGNSKRNACERSPAGSPDVIAVGATAIDDTIGDFSNFGECLDMLAPGVNIESTYINTSVKSMNGTSMAAPYVAGAMALILAERQFGSVYEGYDYLKGIAVQGQVSSVWTNPMYATTTNTLLFNGRPMFCMPGNCRGLVA
ncbi:hypothetical protein HK102_006948 [Quaeritorhiza haematococci]|nr:hypothetical protein HK102_006948 [Quaeritorhiza haematococci]